jgi:hypothetical protein
MEPQLPSRNARTKAISDQETFWQVWLPVVLMTVVLVVLTVLVILPGGAGVRSPIADLSVVFLVVLASGGALLIVALFVGLIYGAGYLLARSPYWLKRVQDTTWVISQQARSMTSQVDQRIVGVHINLAALRRAVERVVETLQSRRRQ